MQSRILQALIMLLVLSSCLTTNKLYKEITRNSYSLHYLFDTEVDDNPKGDTVLVNMPLMLDSGFTYEGGIIRTKNKVVPLLVINELQVEHQYMLGANIIQENVSEFIRKSLIAEINRSTSIYADSMGRAGLVLDIKIDSLGAIGMHYKEDLDVYYYSQGIEMVNGVAYSAISYTLSKENKMVRRGKVFNEKNTTPIMNQFRNVKELRQFLAPNLVEALSLSIKENIEMLAAEVEEFRDSEEK